MTIKLESGKTYLTQSGIEVKLVRHAPSLWYSYKPEDPNHIINYERWTENGEAYHSDCGFNIVSEVLKL